MDLALIRTYLAQLDAMRADPAHRQFAAELLNELAHPLNTIEDMLAPVHRGLGLTPSEAVLRQRVVRALSTRADFS